MSQQQVLEHPKSGGNAYADKKIYWQETTKSLNPYDILKQSSGGEDFCESDWLQLPESSSNSTGSSQQQIFPKQNSDNKQRSNLGTSDNYSSLSTPLLSHNSSAVKSAGVGLSVPTVRITSRFKRTLKTTVEPNTSHQNAIQQNTHVHMDDEKLQGNNVPTISQQISYPHSIMKTRKNVSLPVRKLNLHWKSHMTMTHTTKSQIGVGPDALSTREQTNSIWQKRKLDREQPTISVNNVQQMSDKQHPRPQSSRGRTVLAELISFTRKSPRKRPHVPVYSNKRVKTKKVFEEQSDVGYRQCCIFDLPKKRQLLQRTKPPSVPDTETDNNSNADIDEKHSPLVRGKTRSRTRYYSTVGAVYNPPEPQDYRQQRSWPTNIGLVYTDWPQDFTELEMEPTRPVSDKEISAHHALHYIIAIVAVTAAARRCNGISASEAMVLQYMLCKLGQCFPQDSSTQDEVNMKQKSSLTTEIYRDIGNVRITESSDTESLSCLKKTGFLETLGLKESDTEKENAIYSSASEESWMSMVKAMMLHVTQILQGFSDSKDRFSQEQDHHGSSLLQTLTTLLKKLLETITLLYSVVCDTPYEVVEEYVASQTPETILEWMKDMVTDIPST